MACGLCNRHRGSKSGSTACERCSRRRGSRSGSMAYGQCSRRRGSKSGSTVCRRCSTHRGSRSRRHFACKSRELAQRTVRRLCDSRYTFVVPKRFREWSGSESRSTAWRHNRFRWVRRRRRGSTWHSLLRSKRHWLLCRRPGSTTLRRGLSRLCVSLVDPCPCQNGEFKLSIRCVSATVRAELGPSSIGIGPQTHPA